MRRLTREASTTLFLADQTLDDDGLDAAEELVRRTIDAMITRVGELLATVDETTNGLTMVIVDEAVFGKDTATLSVLLDHLRFGFRVAVAVEADRQGDSMRIDDAFFFDYRLERTHLFEEEELARSGKRALA